MNSKGQSEYASYPRASDNYDRAERIEGLYAAYYRILYAVAGIFAVHFLASKLLGATSVPVIGNFAIAYVLLATASVSIAFWFITKPLVPLLGGTDRRALIEAILIGILAPIGIGILLAIGRAIPVLTAMWNMGMPRGPLEPRRKTIEAMAAEFRRQDAERMAIHEIPHRPS